MFKKFFVVFLFVVISNFSDAFGANISTDTHWSEGEYSMNSLTVSNGATLTIDGGSTINVTGTVDIRGNSKIVLKSKDNAGQIDGQWQGSGVTINGGNITIESGSKISADGWGYLGGAGPGVGSPDSYMHAGSGGGYGGQGGNSGGSSQGGGIGGLTYGSSTMPIDLGSGGGSAGGNGGGSIRLNVAGVLTLDGEISADGASGTNTPCGPGAGGGGSGGSILVTVGTLTGNGSFTVNGGAGGIGACFGTGDDAGGGGGGRIAVYYASEQSYSGFNTSSANGGAGANAGQRGTVAFINTTENHLRVSSQALTFGEDASVDYSAITLENGAVLTVGGGSTINVVNSMNITGNSTIILQGKDKTHQVDGQWQGSGVTINGGNITIESGSKISADGWGYLGGAGPGVGSPDSYMHAGSGGGYGGQGGNSGGSSQGGGIGGLTYGSSTMPIDLGSGGGSAGGNGGGSIRLNVAGVLTLDGEISADGASGTNTPCGPGAGGGGSGGSILVTVGTLTGNGSFTVNGGAGGIGACFGTGDDAGGGGGGRIAVYYASEQSYSGFNTSSANGGAGANAGQRGTVAFINTTENHLRVSSQALTFGEDASVDYSAITLENGAVLTVGGGSTINVVNSMNITGNSTIILQGKDKTHQVDGQWQGSGVTINGGNITIESGSKISADGQGYLGGAGPGVGSPDSYMHAGSGGGYGGQGGNSGGSSAGGGVGGLVYGSSIMPTDLGSGGGAAGGNGGGSIRLNVAGVLTLDGEISADGGSATNTPCGVGAGGGGAGGSILVIAGTLAGSGSFTANGGVGGVGGCYGSYSASDDGGGGGGGRIAIFYWSAISLPIGNITVSGGLGANAGYPGTIVINMTPPGSPSSLISIQDIWTDVNSFSVTWNNPTDSSGIVAAWYKMGSPPTSNNDGVRVLGNDIQRLDNLVVPAEGETLLYVWLEDVLGNKDYHNRAQVTLKFDGSPPVAGTIFINDEAQNTNSLLITLNNLGATDLLSGLTQMRFSNNPGGPWSSPEPYSSNKTNWDLSQYGGNSNAGPKTVYVQFMDGAGNWSNSFSNSIYYNPVQPFPFIDDFGTDKGWVGYEVGGWERKAAVAGGGENGNPDPATDHSASGDNYILGFAIGGDYPNDLLVEKAIVSPPINCTGQNQVFLKFWRYLNVGSNYSDHAKIYVSNDETNWTQLWENPVFDLTDNSWIQTVFDISSIAANQATLYIKFTMGPTDSLKRFSGWNIDDLEVTSDYAGPLALYVPSGGIPNPNIDEMLIEAGLGIEHSNAIPIDLSDYELLIVSEYGACNSTTASYIKNFVQNGGSAIIMGDTPSFLASPTQGIGTADLSSIKDWFGAWTYGNDCGYATVNIPNPFGRDLLVNDKVDYIPSSTCSGNSVYNLDSDADFASKWLNLGRVHSFKHTFGLGRVFYYAGNPGYSGDPDPGLIENGLTLFEAGLLWALRLSYLNYVDTVQKIYIGYYQRPADPGGLLYWAARLDASAGNLNEIIEAFANSAESQALYGTINSSNISTVVNGIYKALFGRDAEAGGLSYYVNGFNSGHFTAATIMLNVLYGAQNEDLQSINNKLAAANLFTRTIDPELDGTDFQATYSGNADAIAGRNFLAFVTWNPTTVPTQYETTVYMKSNIADPGDPILNAPLISNLNYSPTSATLNSGGGTVTVTGSFNFTDADGNLSTVTWTVFDTLGNQIGSYTETITGAAGVTSGTISFIINGDTTESGNFSLNVYVTDITGLHSNTLSGTFLVDIMVASNVAPAGSDTESPGRPSIGYDGNNYLIVYRNIIGATDTLYGTLVSKTGTIVSSFQISDHGSNRSAVAFDGTNYLVAFGTSGGIIGQRVSPAGITLDGSTGFSISTGPSNWSPAIVFDGVNYMVVWEKFVNNAAYDIYGTKITPSGQVLGEFPVTTRPGEQIDPSIAFDGTNYFVCWRDTFSGSGPSLDTHIYGSRIKLNGTVLDPAGIPITTAPGVQDSPQIVFDGTNYFAVWNQWDNIQPTAVCNIFGKRINQGGTLIDGTASTQGIAINTSAYQFKGTPSVTFDGAKYFFVWPYTAYSNYTPSGIYAAKVSTMGVVDGSPDQAGLALSGPPPDASKFVYPVVLYNGVNSFLVWVNNSEVAGSSKDIRGILVNP